MTDDIVTAQITITRSYDPTAIQAEAADTINVDYGDGLTLIEILGMLEFAKADAIADLVLDIPEDD